MDLRALYGTDEPQPPGRRLSCGPAEVTLEAGQLRHLRIGGVEAIRGISFLVRDRDWGTVAPVTGPIRVEATGQGSRVVYRADYDLGTGRLTAEVRLDLGARGLVASASVVATGEVWTNRAGFAVLHPVEGVAGAPLRVDHPDGRHEEACFPRLIAPWQPFRDIAALTHQAGAWRVTCRFEGDVFEMEDQRQWGDASFKTYNRPLALPWPYRLEHGARIDQSVRIDWQPLARPVAVPPVRADAPAPVFPQTALLLTGPDARRAAANPRDLHAIAPQRLLCHLDASAGPLDADLHAFAALQAVCPDHAYDLELIAACVPGGDLRAEFGDHAAALAGSGLRAASLMVTPAADRQSTPPGADWPACPPLEAIHAAARAAFAGLATGGGVASFFPELNRKRPPVEMLDFVSHGLCPIVHAADDLSVIETLEAVPHILASGRAIIGARDYRLGPSTIAMRHNPYGSRTIPNPRRIRLCMAADDPRQDGAFAAAWTCGLAVALAGAGLAVWTPAELYGPRGLFADDGAARQVAAVVAALAGAAGAPVRDARIAGGLAVLDLGERRLVANLAAEPASLAGQADLPGFGWRLGHAKDAQGA